jgi:hypothetical protein
VARTETEKFANILPNDRSIFKIAKQLEGLTGISWGSVNNDAREFSLSDEEMLVGWLFPVLRPTQECFTYMETSPLPVKGCKFRPMLGAQGL